VTALLAASGSSGAGSIALHVGSVVIGTAVTLTVLVSALETVVLPRQGFTRIARVSFAVTDRILVHPWRNQARRDNLRALYAPIALVSLPLVWMLAVIVGFSFIFWGIDSGSVQHSFEISGSSVTTLGFADPKGSLRSAAAFVEAIIGLGLVALLISYLPTIYAAHREREQGIATLRPFAGVPPAPAAMLGNLTRLDVVDNPDFWRTAAEWMLELDQTHCAFPALCYFPESSPEQSWVASVGSLLDAAALRLSEIRFHAGGDPSEDPSEEAKGPMLVLAYGMPTIVRIGRAAGLPVEPPGILADLLARVSEPAPEISIHREEFLPALDGLQSLASISDDEQEAYWRQFAWIRSSYDRALRGLAGLTLADSAEWTTDRPAAVGRPRLLTTRPLEVDWTMPAAPAAKA
jgi:hypothetical protein